MVFSKQTLTQEKSGVWDAEGQKACKPPVQTTAPGKFQEMRFIIWDCTENKFSEGFWNFVVILRKLSDRNIEIFKGNKKTRKLVIGKAKNCKRNDI